MGDGAGVGARGAGGGGLHRQRAVGGEPVRPILEPRFQRLLDQQAAKAGAVDEQIAFDQCAIVQRQRGDVAAFAIAPHLFDAAFMAGDTQFLGKIAQEQAVGSGIEVIGIVERDIAAGAELARQRRLRLEAVIAERPGHAQRFRFEPHMLEIGHPGGAAHDPERVEIAFALARPVLEGNAQLEACPRGAQERGFIEPEQFVEAARGGDGAFAHADRADRVGFDQHDVDQRAEVLDQRRRDGPACGAAACDHHLPYRLALSHQHHSLSVEPPEHLCPQPPRSERIERGEGAACVFRKVRACLRGILAENIVIEHRPPRRALARGPVAQG